MTFKVRSLSSHTDASFSFEWHITITMNRIATSIKEVEVTVVDWDLDNLAADQKPIFSKAINPLVPENIHILRKFK